MQEPQGLQGRVAVVTGAASGIGRAVVLQLVRAGCRVAALDRDAQGNQATVAQAHAEGGQAIAVACDIGDEAGVRAAAAASRAAFGPCDILVNCAGILSTGAMADLPLADWNRMLSVNLTGALLCSQAFGAQMRARKRGAIVHVSSIAADHPTAWAGCYSITKAGLSMLSRLLAVEWAADGIRSNAVKPGMVRTGMTATMYANREVETQRSRIVPLGRIGEPEDIARAVVFLASDAAAYITGQELMVDGGLERSLMGLLPRA